MTCVFCIHDFHPLTSNDAVHHQDFYIVNTPNQPSNLKFTSGWLGGLTSFLRNSEGRSREKVVVDGVWRSAFYLSIQPYWFEVSCPGQTFYPSSTPALHGWYLCYQVEQERARKNSVCLSPGRCGLAGAEEPPANNVWEAMEMVVTEGASEDVLSYLLSTSQPVPSCHLLIVVCNVEAYAGLLISTIIHLRDHLGMSMFSSHLPRPNVHAHDTQECWYIGFVSTLVPQVHYSDLGPYPYAQRLAVHNARYPHRRNHISYLLSTEAGRDTLAQLMPYPVPYICHNCKRFGNYRDGGWQVCLDHGLELDNSSIVYSFGLAGDWSFDLEIVAATGCQLHAFDHTISGYKGGKLPPTLTYHHLGLSATDQTETKSLSTIVNMLGHMNKTLDLVKMDIEGSEKGVLESLLDEAEDKVTSGRSLLLKIKQLAFEWHSPEPYGRTMNLMQRLHKNNMFLYMSHINPYCRQCYELYFINRAYLVN